MADAITATDGQQAQDRHIEIHHDAINSAIISGDNNKVVIYHYHLDQQVQSKERASLSKLGANPYRGLAAFQVEDAAVFFGREKEVDRLWNRLWNLYEQSQHDKLLPRLLPILGPSGSGKSSLARAGLLPELARRPLPGYKQTNVVIVKPGETPLEKLALILARIATGDPSPVGKAQEFKEVLEKRHEQGTNDGLSFIASMLPEQDYPLVVLVDQFEEIYSLDANVKQRTAFVETLLEASVTRKAQVSVVITLRSDFLGETQRHPKFNQIIGSDQSVFLPVMTSEELHLAIEKPAEQAGHPLDFATVDQLVNQTQGREGALPLLQFALTRIWKELSDSNFSKSSKEILRDIGGVGGALAGEAERIYTNLNSQEQDIARRVFVGLTQIGGGDRYTRRRVEVDSLLTKQDKWEQVREVLDRFSSPSARLITLLSTDGEEVAEVTHEALFEHWKQLKVWLDGQRDLIRQRDKIEDAAEEWQQQGQKRGYLLQGRQLSDANRFRKQETRQFSLSQEAAHFLRRSLRQQRVNRLSLLGLLILPALLIEASLREVRVSNLFADVEDVDRARKRQAILALTEGCQKIVDIQVALPSYILERLFGLCRPFKNRDISSVDLSNINLGATTFERVNLDGANLSRTNLSSGQFLFSNLNNANLRSAVLFGAFLGGAGLNNADLNEANLGNAYLGSVQMSNANLSDAYLYRADISGANLGNANLSSADLSRANLSDANLSSANLSFADLDSTNLSNANLSHANLTAATNWTQEQLSLAKLCQTSLPPELTLDSNRDCRELGIQVR